MADEDDVEVAEVKNEKLVSLRTLDDLKEKVFADPENLCFVACTSKLCPYSASLEPAINAIAESAGKGPTQHVRCFAICTEDCEEELLLMLRLAKVPMFHFYLKGTPRSEPFVGSSEEKLKGMYRNQVIKRNEEMREYDEAKLAELEALNKPPEEEAAEDEVEE
jgi:hypothetical protein